MSAVTQNSYIGNGSTTNYSFTFPYLKSTDVEVQVDATVTTAWQFANATTVQFNTAPANGAKIKILRQTNVDSLAATFYAGSAIKSEDLNDNYTQNLYKTQEVGQRFFSNTGGTMTGDLTMAEDTSIIFEGATDDNFETTLAISDPTADRTITLPNVTGTVITTGDTGTVTSSMIADGTITQGDIANSAVTTQKINNDAVTSDKIANDAINSEHYAATSIDTEHIANENITTAKLANDAVTSAKLADNAVLTANITDANVTHTKLANDAVDGDNIANDSINSEHYVDGSIDTAHISNDAINGDKIANDAINSEHYVDGSIDHVHLSNDCIDGDNIQDNAVGAEHIQANAVTDSEIATGTLDNRYFTETELTNGALDGRYFTETESDARYFNISSGDTIKDGDSFPDNDTTIATTAAINDRIIDLVDDVGGFVPIASETAFPTANPDVNNGAGTLVSIKAIGTTRTPSSGTVTIANGSGSNTVTITGCGSTVLTAGFGVIVETTSTLHTYAFHRLVPKATEVTTVAGSISNVNSVAGSISNVNTTASNISNVNTVAGINANVTTVAGISSDVTTVANNNSNVTAVADNASNINSVASNASNINSAVSNASNINSAVSNASNINSAVSNATNINTVAGSISNVNTAATNIASINTAASNITNVNNFTDRYQIASSNPSTDGGGNALAEGDLFFNTTSNELKVYNGSAWQGGVTATGNFANTTGDTYTGDSIHNDNVKSIYGTGSDLKIYHNGTDSYIENSTGNLFINHGTDKGVKIEPNNKVQLFHDNSLKFETLSTGANVYGNITLSGNVDGRDVAADGTKLDGIEANATADQTASEIVALVADQTIAPSEIDMEDNEKIKLGTGDDLELYHDSTHSFIQKGDGTGNLYVDANGIILRGANGETLANFTENGSVELYHNNASRLQTTASGISVTGTIFGSSNLDLPDNGKLKLGTDDDLQIFHDGTQSVIKDNGTGQLLISGENTIALTNASGTETYARFLKDDAVELYYDNSKKLETTSTGIEVTGQISTTSELNFTGNGSKYIDFATLNGSDAISFRHQDGSSYELAATFTANGAAKLHYDGSKKFETTSTGITVSGTQHKFTSGTSGDCELILEADTDNNNENDNPKLIFRQDGGTDVSCFEQVNNKLTISNSVSAGGISFKTGTAAGYTNATERFSIDKDGTVDVVGNLDVGSGLDVTGDITITDASPSILFNDNTGSPQDPDYKIIVNTGKFEVYDNTNSATRFTVNSDGHIDIAGNLDVTGAITSASTGNASLILDAGTGSASGNQTSFIDFKNSGTLKGNIAVNESVSGTPLELNSAGGTGAVALYHNGAKKFETISDGCTVSENLNVGSELNLTGGSDASRYIDSQVGNSGAAHALHLRCITGGDAGHENMARFFGGGQVELYHDNSLKFETTDYGSAITGNLQCNGSTNNQVALNATDGSIEISRANGSPFIDFKNTVAEDYDHRLKANDDGFTFNDTINLENSGFVHLNIKSTNNDAVLQLTSNNDDTKEWTIRNDYSDSYGLDFRCNNNRKMDLDVSGNLTIVGDLHLDNADRVIWGTSDTAYIEGDDNNYLIFGVNNEKARLTTTGLGIGTTSPAGKVHANSATNTATFLAEGDVSNPDYPAYGFSGQNHSNGERGTGMYLAGDNQLAFATVATERFRIDANGNFDINNGAIMSSYGGDNNIDAFHHDDGDNAWIFNSDTTLKATTGTSSLRCAAIDFGDNNNAADKLDEYEEGAWTPELKFGGSSSGITYSHRTGVYTKIGRVVTVHFAFAITDKGNQTGHAEIHGIPYSAGDYLSNTTVESNGMCAFWDNVAPNGHAIMFHTNSAHIEIKYIGSTGEDKPPDMTNSNFEDNTSMRGSLTYFTAT